MADLEALLDVDEHLGDLVAPCGRLRHDVEALLRDRNQGAAASACATSGDNRWMQCARARAQA
eukprot:6177973-Pleurochrysis_carterae.AAC.2